MKHRKEKQGEHGSHRESAPESERLYRRGQGYYGSGGSYGYGGGFEHPDYPEQRIAHNDTRRARRQEDEVGLYQGRAPMEPFDAYGSFGNAMADPERQRQHESRAPRTPTRGPFFGRSPQGYTRSDERIREDICDQLMYGHVDPSAIRVAVSEGEVTLDGRVDDRRDKYTVEEIAASVLGVRDVTNRLRVGQSE
jgi:hypothetical protein